MPTKPPKPSTLLKRALKLFGPRGQRWIQERYSIRPHSLGYKPEYKKGAFCAVGSIRFVNTQRQDEALEYLRIATVRMTERNSGVENYNDAKGRTFPQIRKLFTTAIELATKAGN